MFVLYLIFSILMGLGFGIAMVKENPLDTFLNILTVILNMMFFPIVLPIILGKILYIKK